MNTKISEAVGVVGSMPGTEGFTMACFKADEVPVGTPLFLHPQPAELAEQQGVDMADADTVALEIARRFIPVDSPGAHNEGQQRAALQVAIVGAINAALAATGKKQVGEVQGDALMALAANWHVWADRHELSALEADSIGGMPTTVDVHETKSEVFRQVAAELETALAARQPGVQVPIAHVPVHPRIGPLWSDAIPAGSAVHRSDSYPLMAVYAAPPTQGIDVGQQQDAARYRWLRSQNVGMREIDRTLFEVVHDDCNPPYRGMKHGESLDAAIDSLIDGQRDAAPGVG